eukprot:2758603-Rhodomonas_salina.1
MLKGLPAGTPKQLSVRGLEVPQQSTAHRPDVDVSCRSRTVNSGPGRVDVLGLRRKGWGQVRGRFKSRLAAVRARRRMLEEVFGKRAAAKQVRCERARVAALDAWD